MSDETDPTALVARATELVSKATPGPWKGVIGHCECDDGSGPEPIVAIQVALAGYYNSMQPATERDRDLIIAAPALITDLAAALSDALAREAMCKRDYRRLSDTCDHLERCVSEARQAVAEGRLDDFQAITARALQQPRLAGPDRSP